MPNWRVEQRSDLVSEYEKVLFMLNFLVRCGKKEEVFLERSL
jgi:hypothetical protein